MSPKLSYKQEEMSIQKNLLSGNVHISCLRIINSLLRTIHKHEYCADRLHQNFMLKDARQKDRVNILISEIIACLPTIFWALTNLSHLSSGRGIGWIGKPDYGLFESI